MGAKLSRMFSRQQSDEVQVNPTSEPKFSWFSSLRRRRTMESMPALRSGSLKRSTLPFKRKTTEETQGTNGRVEKYATLKAVTQSVEAPQVATTNLGMTSSAPSQQLPAAAAASVPVFDEKPKHDSSPFEMENNLQDSFVIIPQKIQKGLEHVPPENLLMRNIEEEQARNLPNSIDLTNKENMHQPDKRSVAQSESESVCPGPVEVEQTEKTETEGKQRSNQIIIQMRERDRSESVHNVARDSLQLRNEDKDKEKEYPSSAKPWMNETNNDDIPAMYKNISNFQHQSEPEPTSPKGTDKMGENKAKNYEEILESSKDLLESNISTSKAEPMQRNYTWESNTQTDVHPVMIGNQTEKINQAYKRETYMNQLKEEGNKENQDTSVLDKAVCDSDQLQSHIPEDDDAFRATASGEVEHVLSAAMSSEGDFDWRGDQIGRRDETEESEAKREHEGVEEQFTGVSAVRDRGSGDIFEPDLRSSARDDFSHVQLRDRDGSSSLLHGRFSSENAAVDRGSTVSSTFSFDIFRNSHFSSSGAESHPFALDSSYLIPPDTDSASAISPDFVGLLHPSDASGGEVAPALNGTHNTGNPLDVESSHLSKIVSADGCDDNYQKLSLFGLESSPGVVFTRDNIRSSVTGESHDVTSKSDISGSSKPLGSEEDVI